MQRTSPGKPPRLLAFSNGRSLTSMTSRGERPKRFVDPTEQGK